MICRNCGKENAGAVCCTDCGAQMNGAEKADFLPPPRYVPPEMPKIPEGYRPMGPWGYFGWRLLFAIPVVGLVLLIVFACGAGSNRNLRNFARSYFAALLVAALLAGVGVLALLVMDISFADVICAVKGAIAPLFQ